jgi:acyl-CoA thioester hydrolase
MFSESIKPGFSDTDALGHINNTKLPIWFENAREPFFKMFVPDLDYNKWCLIVAHINVDFQRELFMQQPIEIRSYIKKIGNSSFVVGHEAWQQHQLAASGEAVMIHYDFEQKQSKPIPDSIRAELTEHLLTDHLPTA